MAPPNFALVVPNQCDEMHGLHGPGVLPNRAITSIDGCTLTHLGEHFHSRNWLLTVDLYQLPRQVITKSFSKSADAEVGSADFATPKTLRFALARQPPSQITAIVEVLL